MNIKEIFEIEPNHKNILIIFIGIFGLSFLQLYLFKNSIFDTGIFFTLGISLGLSVCWSILNFPSLTLFYAILMRNSTNDTTYKSDSRLVVFLLGLIALSWISALTFVAYVLNLNFKILLLISVAISIIRTLTWLIVRYVQYQKEKKQKA